MSKDKYPCIFSRQMATIVYILLRRPTTKIMFLSSQVPAENGSKNIIIMSTFYARKTNHCKGVA